MIKHELENFSVITFFTHSGADFYLNYFKRQKLGLDLSHLRSVARVHE